MSGYVVLIVCIEYPCPTFTRLLSRVCLVLLYRFYSLSIVRSGTFVPLHSIGSLLVQIQILFHGTGCTIIPFPSSKNEYRERIAYLSSCSRLAVLLVASCSLLSSPTTLWWYSIYSLHRVKRFFKGFYSLYTFSLLIRPLLRQKRHSFEVSLVLCMYFYLFFVVQDRIMSQVLMILVHFFTFTSLV